MRLELYIENHLDNEPDAALPELWRQAALLALQEKQIASGRVCELNLLLCGDEEIREYNSSYRNIDKETDVLSFPMLEDWREIELLPPDAPALIGDIIISLPRAAAQAAEYGHSFRREAVFLFIHGLLHCLGYDHLEEQDERVMRQKQRELLDKLQISD